MSHLTDGQMNEAIIALLEYADRLQREYRFLPYGSGKEVAAVLKEIREPPKGTPYVAHVIGAEQVPAMYSIFDTSCIPVGDFGELNLCIDALYEIRENLKKAVVEKERGLRAQTRIIESLEKERKEIRDEARERFIVLDRIANELGFTGDDRPKVSTSDILKAIDEMKQERDKALGKVKWLKKDRDSWVEDYRKLQAEKRDVTFKDIDNMKNEIITEIKKMAGKWS